MRLVAGGRFWVQVHSLLVIVGLLCSASPGQEKAKAEDDPELREAFELYDNGKVLEAMPLLERVAASHPKDGIVFEHWAYATLSYAATLTNNDTRKKARVRAKQIATKAKELGYTSPILQLVLQVPDDGTDIVFSQSKEVDAAMKEAEAHFVRGDMEKARAGYLRALLLDPNNYEANLFMGDAYFRDKVYGSAGEWYARAIVIDANREAAYRYWADALAAMGKNEDARLKFIEAVLAEPYSQLSWSGLQKWANQNKVKLNFVKLKDRSAVEIKDSKNINITLDSGIGKNDPNSLAWTTYGLGRAAWHTEASEKEFPNIPRNRHTLQEEAHALDLMVTVLKEQKNYEKKRKDLDPGLQLLVSIREAGLLEPFVLLNRADPEIAQDYDTYRAANREKIRRYLDEFVVPKAH